MHEGAERRLLETVLIHKHHARVSPRLIPGSSPRSAALLMTARTDVENAEQQALIERVAIRNGKAQLLRSCSARRVWPERIRGGSIPPDRCRVTR